SLERSVGAVRLCPDDWMYALQLSLWDEPARARVEALQWTLAQRLLAIGQTVVIEWGTWARSERDTLRAGAKALRAAVELHYCTARLDVLFDRIQRRARESSPPTRPQVEQWARAFQEPTADEGASYDRFWREDTG